MGKYAPSTVRTYNDLVGRFVKFIGPEKTISELEITDITRYFVHLKSKGYYESSIAFMMVALRQFMKYLFLRGETRWDYQLVAVPKYVSRSFSPIESSEAKAMIDGIREEKFTGMRDKTLLSFLYSSGMRVSEICSLELRDLRLNDHHGSIISKKNRKIRMVFWDTKTDELMKRYLPQRKLWSSSDHVFISMDRRNRGGRLSTRSVQRLVADLRPRSDISPHSFRHGLGMRAVKSGIHPRYIQKILGHKNINSSQVYLDVHDEDVVTAYAKIAAYKKTINRRCLANPTADWGDSVDSTHFVASHNISSATVMSTLCIKKSRR